MKKFHIGLFILLICLLINCSLACGTKVSYNYSSYINLATNADYSEKIIKNKDELIAFIPDYENDYKLKKYDYYFFEKNYLVFIKHIEHSRLHEYNVKKVLKSGKTLKIIIKIDYSRKVVQPAFTEVSFIFELSRDVDINKLEVSFIEVS